MIQKELRILIIDDDQDDFVHIQDLFSDITGSKFITTWSSTYSEGLENLKAQKFDACLLDYRLGAKTGIEFLQESSQLGIVCPIILLTGFGDFELDVQAMEVGAADYLVKDQLTAPLLERSVRYSIKHVMDMEELRESKAHVLQQDRLASLGLLASSLAHEIGTPLGVIRSRAELTEKAAGENQKLKKDMGIVISQIDRITKLVNSLLHLAREKKSDFGSAVDLDQALDDVLTLVQHELKMKDIELVQDHRVKNIKVKAESGPLAQVFLNLMINSIHAIESAKKQFRAGPFEISIRTEEVGEKVKIFVRDTGCGIPEDHLMQIFKPFFTTKDVGLGTGLGLAVSYKYVQSWGGTLSVESQFQKETTFIVELCRSGVPLTSRAGRE